MTDLLLADDDVELCGMLSEYLHSEGFSVTAVHDGNAAIAAAFNGHYDAMVLDVMMPGKNGFDVLRELRPRCRLPVLILTARGDDVDSVVGLELGADDYLAKPCNPRVLVARLRAILRRAGPADVGDHGATALQVGDLELHGGTRQVILNGQTIATTSTEYCLLEALLGQAGQIVAKADLSQQALGRELGRWDRSIDMHISNLRKKLGPRPDGGERIKTVRGKGYQYVNSHHQ